VLAHGAKRQNIKLTFHSVRIDTGNNSVLGASLQLSKLIAVVILLIALE